MEETPATLYSPRAPPTTTPTAPAADDNFVMIEESDLKKLFLDQLKKESKKKGLATSGLKAELQDCLTKAMEDRIPVLQEKI